ncbi:Protein CBG18810 [Caenorhabditis briggsae]|uniref:Protein CBG18810 n=3 Tax=Caenorhabditis briggsae TaxID=6238 RepID=A8XU58_CAEBR|nr:Protein CBG18810 [Caenorhabditis briggsae]ULU13829.1 hypothetical protein L3Y34_016374 [Caenorhabditis briggsae]CAP36183.1 Protein CBG18810 [Caenorhabditis briggsae]
MYLLGMRFLLPLLAFLLPSVHGQWKVDEGLQMACNQTGSMDSWHQRDDAQSAVGDKCAMRFNVATRDQADADEFCQLYAPWRFEKAVREDAGRPTVTCHVEATFTCRTGWMQMFGYCFRMPDKNLVANFTDAQDICAKEHGVIAYMHHRYIVGVWKRFFHGVSQVWVRASETWDQYIQKTNRVDGDALALAFTGIHYNFAVPANSLIKIDPSIRLQVLCQYKPNNTAAEVSYLGRRYSEIYYPVVQTDNGILVRTASSYTRSSKNKDMCKKAVKPFMSYISGPFLSNKEALTTLRQTNFPLTWMYRAGVDSDQDYKALSSSQIQQSCSKHFYVMNDDGEIWSTPAKQSTKCTMLSYAINTLQGTMLYQMPDARSLPMWCALGQKVEFKYRTDDGYTLYHRKNGEVVGHKLVTTEVTYDEAKKLCMAEGGLVSGVNSDDEAEKMTEIAKKAGLDTKQIWLGGKRRAECNQIDGFSEDPNSDCGRNNVIMWEHNVATAFYDHWWRNGEHHDNPSYWKGQQNCLTLVVGSPAWSGSITAGFLDDISCASKHPFFCTKPADIDEESLWGKS